MNNTDQAVLQSALNRSGHPDIKILGLNAVAKVAVREARLMVAAGDFEWGGSARRVRWMRPINSTAWHHCWRAARTTQESAAGYDACRRRLSRREMLAVPIVAPEKMLGPTGKLQPRGRSGRTKILVQNGVSL